MHCRSTGNPVYFVTLSATACGAKLLTASNIEVFALAIRLGSEECTACVQQSMPSALRPLSFTLCTGCCCLDLTIMYGYSAKAACELL